MDRIEPKHRWAIFAIFILWGIGGAIDAPIEESEAPAAMSAPAEEQSPPDRCDREIARRSRAARRTVNARRALSDPEGASGHATPQDALGSSGLRRVESRMSEES